MSENRLPDFMNASLNLSSEEFCRQLSVWFEDRGLISDLRAHLRSQMIAALRGTSIGAKPSRKTISPKFQAINLIIAEFLLQQEHHYTLSVFTSEVPLQEFTHKSVINLSRGNATTDERLPRFHRRDLWDILETLGLSPDSEESNRVYNMYQENQGEALLTCIFRILPALSKNRLKKDLNESTDSVGVLPKRETGAANTLLVQSAETNREISVETLHEEITNIINQSTLKSYKKSNLRDKINQLIKLERVRVQQDAEQKYERELNERENTFQANLIQKENFFKKYLSQSEEKVLKEKKELEKGKKDIADVAVQLREGHAHITRSFNELQERQEILRMREVEMERLRQIETARFVEQANELDIQKRQLDQEFKRLEEEQGETQCLRNGIQNLRRNLDVANHALSESQSQLVVVNDLQHQCAYLRRELNSSKHYLKQLSAIRKNSLKQVNQSQQTDHCKDTLNDESSSKPDVNVNEMYRQLQQENAELRARSHQQEERINELTTRATHLAMEVELAQTALASATQANTYRSSSDLGSVPPVVAHVDENPPPPPPPLPPRNVTPVPSYLGGGEDLVGQSAVLHTVTPTQTQRHIETRETRRKPPRRLVIHTSTSSDESSPTDEVLQEARRRLRTLEEESAEVDRRFRDFKQRQASFFETAASVLSPGVPNPPPLSHRFSDLASRQSRYYTSSVPPTYYGASSSGVPHSRHVDVLTKPSPINDIHGASSSQLPSSIRQFTHVNMTPSIDRITDIFRSSTSSDSDSIRYLFSHQTPHHFEMSPSYTRQSLRMETYDNTPHRKEYFNYLYKKREGLSNITREAKTLVGANSESTKHKSEEVPFIPSSNIARSSLTELHGETSPKADHTTAVQPNITKSSSYKNLQEESECNMPSVVDMNEAVLSRPHIVNNAVERYELQQVMMVDKTTFELESETHKSQDKQRTNMQVAKPDTVLPDACPAVETLPSSSTSESLQENEPVGVITLQSEDNFRSTAQENTTNIRGSLLPQQENMPKPEGASTTLDDKKLEISSSSNEPEHLNTKESVVQQSPETQDRSNDQVDFQEETGTLVKLDQGQQTEQANISTMVQSGSGSTFALSAGKMSVSSIAMSSDSHSSPEQSDEPQSTQAPLSTIKITNVQVNNAGTNSDAHVTDSQTSDVMSAPDEKDQSEDDFWA